MADERIDRLYELPLGEFTAERNELARRLRKEGDREAADEVKQLRKPSEPAWAVNQLARRNKRELNALLRAGEQLREAQQKAIGGGRDKLRAAIAEEREQVGKLAALAEPLVGPRPGPKLDRVRAVLHAAAIDEATREAIAAGRLVEDAEGIGLGPFGPSGTEAEVPSSGGRARGGAKRSRGADRGAAGRGRGSREDDRAQRDRERAAVEARMALRAVEAARKQEKAAGEKADAARRELDRVRDQAKEVAKALQGAERRVKEAEARESEAQAKLAVAQLAAREHA